MSGRYQQCRIRESRLWTSPVIGTRRGVTALTNSVVGKLADKIWGGGFLSWPAAKVGPQKMANLQNFGMEYNVSSLIQAPSFTQEVFQHSLSRNIAEHRRNFED